MQYASPLEIFCRVTALLLLCVTSAHAISYVPEGIARGLFGVLAAYTFIGVPYGTHKGLYIKSFLSIVIMFTLIVFS